MQRALGDKTYIDLFAGCGGLSLGLHEAGWSGLFAIERDPMAFETLRANFIAPGAAYRGYCDWPDWLPIEPHGIEELLLSSQYRRELLSLRGQVELIVGGPPCQGFSVGGIRDGQDARNGLVHQMLEVVGLVEPKLVVIENVPGIAREFLSKPGLASESVADQVVHALADLGYQASYTIVDASDFGVPQVRKRVLIVGARLGILGTDDPAGRLHELMLCNREGFLDSLGLPTRRKVTVREALDDLNGADQVTCPDSPLFQSGTYRSAESAYAKLMRRGIDSDVIPDSHRFSRHGERISEMYRSAHESQRPGRLPKEFILSFGTKKDKKELLDPERPSSTITTHPDDFIHFSEPRNITIREIARLQAFPDDFKFRGRYTINGPRRRYDVARCSQVGNAVPPLLGQAVGLALVEMVSGENRVDLAVATRGVGATRKAEQLETV